MAILCSIATLEHVASLVTVQIIIYVYCYMGMLQLYCYMGVCVPNPFMCHNNFQVHCVYCAPSTLATAQCCRGLLSHPLWACACYHCCNTLHELSFHSYHRGKQCIQRNAFKCFHFCFYSTLFLLSVGSCIISVGTFSHWHNARPPQQRKSINKDDLLHHLVIKLRERATHLSSTTMNACSAHYPENFEY